MMAVESKTIIIARKKKEEKQHRATRAEFMWPADRIKVIKSMHKLHSNVLTNADTSICVSVSASAVQFNQAEILSAGSSSDTLFSFRFSGSLITRPSRSRTPFGIAI